MNAPEATTPTMPATVAKARFSADRLRWVYFACAHLFDPRTYLQKILIEPAPEGGVYIVATNGALMMIAYDAAGEASHRFTFNPLGEIAKICGFPGNEETLFDGSSYADTILIDFCMLHACRRDHHSQPTETIKPQELVRVLSHEVEIGDYFPDWHPFVTNRGPVNPIPAFIDIDQLQLVLTGITSPAVAITLTRHVRYGKDAEIEPVHIAFETLPLRGVLMPLAKKDGDRGISAAAMPFDTDNTPA